MRDWICSRVAFTIGFCGSVVGMAEGSSHPLGGPSTFKGSEKIYSVKDFIDSFERFASYKNLQEGQLKPAFRFFLADGAARFFDQQPPERTFEEVKKSFFDRYKKSTLSRLVEIGELTRESQKNESVIEFVDRILLKCRELGLSEEETKNIVLRGTKPSARAFILRGDHSTLRELIERASMADECVPSRDDESLIMSVINPLKEAIQSLETPASRADNQSPESNVCLACFFHQKEQWGNEESACWECGGYLENNVNVLDEVEQDPEPCPACGFFFHDGDHCPAEGKICWNCDGMDHFARCCDLGE